MARIKRNVRPTPKDAAADSVRHAKNIADELAEPILDRDKFAYRFNDFIRASRAVLAMLPKEKAVRLPARAGSTGLPDFVRAEIAALKKSDARFRHFMETLKDVSAHDLIVRSDTAQHTFQPDAFQADAFQGPLYYLNDWPKEDLATYCGELVTALDSLVQRVYAQFP